MRRSSIIGAAAVAAILPIGLAATAAFGSTDESTTDSTAQAFSDCMRENGLSDFPDAHLSADGRVQLEPDGEQVDPFSAEYLSALAACDALLPEELALPGEPVLPVVSGPQAPPAVAVDLGWDGTRPSAPPAPSLTAPAAPGAG